MKKVALALLILTITVPAMADVEIFLTNEANVVTISYETDGEIVRAFALNVSVSHGAYLIGSAEPTADPETGDYWVYPTNMTFTVVDGNTVVDEFGSPIAEETGDGGVLEMASLYSVNDPCHLAQPGTSGDLCSFAVDANCDVNDAFVVGVTVNAQRAGVVLEDPDVPAVVVLPDDILVDCVDVVCLKVGQYCGGVMITQQMYDDWVAMGMPVAWCYPSHFAGDSNLDCGIDAQDVVGPSLPNMKASFGKVWPDPLYAPSCDTDNNLGIDAIDVVGGGLTDCLPNGCGCKPNFGRVFVDGIYCF